MSEQEWTVQKATSARDDALNAQCNAEQIAATLEEAVKTLRRQLREEKAEFDLKNEMYFIHYQVQAERDSMFNEEIISRFGKMQEDVAAAERLKAENMAIINDYSRVLQLIKSVEGERDSARQ